MTDQKLVDELEKALTDEAYDGGMGALSGEEFSELVRTLAVTAAEVVEEVHTPTDDERERAERLVARLLPARQTPGTAANIVRYLTEAGLLSHSEVPEPNAEGYAEFEDWEQEMFRHQPVLSMADGSIAGCQCLDRVFVKGEDWGTHLATIITSRITAEPQGEPSDAQETVRRLKAAGVGAYMILAAVTNVYDMETKS